jgi:hypothetical protein
MVCEHQNVMVMEVELALELMAGPGFLSSTMRRLAEQLSRCDAAALKIKTVELAHAWYYRSLFIALLPLACRVQRRYFYSSKDKDNAP